MNAYLNPLLFILLLVNLCSCANKYIVGLNRMVTPETTGERWGVQAEAYKVDGIKNRVDIEQNAPDYPLEQVQVSRMKYLFATGLYRRLDIFYTQTSGSNPIVNLKLQLLGMGKNKRELGHKLALTAGYGMSTGEVDDSSKLSFKSSVADTSLIYGYRWKRKLLFYESFSYTDNTFDSSIKSPLIDITHQAKVMGLQSGVEMTFGFLVMKGEVSYSLINSTNSKDKSALAFAYGAGIEF